MVNLRSFEVPTVVKHAPGAVECLPDQVKALGVKRPMVVTDQGIVKAGIVDKVTEALRAGNVDYLLFDCVVPNPPIKLVDDAAALYAQEGCDGLIGLGGGSPMDTAKAIGVVAENGGSILQYEWADPQPIQKPIPPLITIPTTAGTGSEVTLWSVITDPNRHIKYNVGGTPYIGAKIALIDPLLMLDMPAHITASTGLDALTHAIECYTCGYAQPWPDAVALYAIETLAQWLPIAFAQGHNVEARYKVAMAAMLAGMSYGTESAGAVHAMSQTAGGYYDLPHGVLTAAMLPPVMAYNYLGEPVKYARIAQAMGVDTNGMTTLEAAWAAVKAVKKFVKLLEIPSVPELGVKEEDMQMLVDMAYADPQTFGNPRDLTRKSYEQIYASCFED
ncbi:MAG: iron-containing alcohol dehydrogenase [Anaerolineae bacterium]|jgi:choline dehydrogenase|nr:iron-containing alcohol dehydrogenase [Anaerolineae bacterium]